VKAYEEFLRRFPENPLKGKAVFRLGMACFRLERFDQAAASLEGIAEAARVDETFRPALLALGDIHFKRDEWKEAERRLSEFLAPGWEVAGADDAMLKLGLAQQRQEQHEAALATYDRFLERFEERPHRVQVLFERGQALLALGRAEEAGRAFQGVLKADAKSRFAAYALNHLGALATKKGDYESAARLFGKATVEASSDELSADTLFREALSLIAAKRFAEAQSKLDQFLQRFPAHERAAEAAAQRAIVLSRQDRHKEALSAMEEVESRFGSKLERSLRASLAYEQAWNLRELGRVEEAATAYRALMDEGAPASYRTHALLEAAGLEMLAKRYAEAAALLRQLVGPMDSSDASLPADVHEQALYRLGVCEFELDHAREAATFFDQFIEEFPDSALLASASFYGGEAHFQLGRVEDAVTHLSRVVERFEDDAVFAPAMLRLGEALAQRQLWARSERVFTDFLSRFGDSPQWFQAQFGLGWARENQKRYDEAVSAYQIVTARHQGPTAARAQFQIGECLFAKGQLEDAVRELLKVDILYAYPEWSAASLYEAGRCFEKLNKTAEARTQFKEVAERHKETHWAELASQRLSELSSAGLPGR